MNIEKISYWLMIIGNLGLLLGVVLVVFQISQNSELTREQLNHAMWSDRMNLQLAMMGENPAAVFAKAIESPSAITLEESRVLDAVYMYWSMLEVRSVMMQERGMLVDGGNDVYSPANPRHAIHVPILANEYFKAAFEIQKMGPDLTPKVQPLMDSLAGNENLLRYERTVGLINRRQQQ